MVIAIGGVSRSGKSRLADAIINEFKENTSLIIAQDTYIYPVEVIPQINGMVDWECPESINFQSFYDDINNASKTYDIVIAEGLLVYYQLPVTAQLFDRKLFIEIDNSTFVKRKLLDKRWGNIPTWYIDHIWQSYQMYGTIGQMDQQDFMIIDGNKSISIPPIIDYIKN